MGQVNPVLGRCYINLTLGEFLPSCLVVRKCDDKSPTRRALTELLSSIFFKFITKILKMDVWCVSVKVSGNSILFCFSDWEI